MEAIGYYLSFGVILPELLPHVSDPVFLARLACVQEALRCQASDLHDSLVLNEFLQNVQLEEMLSQSNQTLVRRRKRMG